MDPETAKFLASALVALGGSAGIVGLLFRGNVIVLAREQEASAKHCAERMADMRAANEKLEEALEETQRELKEQYRANADMAKQVFDTTGWLRGLAGLAQRDERRPR